MNLVWTIYLISLLEVREVVIVVSIFGALIWIFLKIMQHVENCQEEYTGIMRKTGWAIIVCISLAVILPTTSTAYRMLAAYGVEEVIANDDAQRLAGKSLELLEQTIDSYLTKEK